MICVMMALCHYHYSELPCIHMHKHRVEMKHQCARKVNHNQFFLYPPTAGEMCRTKYPNTVSSQFIFNLQTTDQHREPPLSHPHPQPISDPLHHSQIRNFLLKKNLYGYTHMGLLRESGSGGRSHFKQTLLTTEANSKPARLGLSCPEKVILQASQMIYSSLFYHLIC